MKWLKSLLLAAFAGGVIAAAAIAPSMSDGGFNRDEWNAIAAKFVTGALGGLAGLFVNRPRDPERRTRATDSAEE